MQGRNADSLVRFIADKKSDETLWKTIVKRGEISYSYFATIGKAFPKNIYVTRGQK